MTRSRVFSFVVLLSWRIVFITCCLIPCESKSESSLVSIEYESKPGMLISLHRTKRSAASISTHVMRSVSSDRKTDFEPDGGRYMFAIMMWLEPAFKFTNCHC